MTEPPFVRPPRPGGLLGSWNDVAQPGKSVCFGAVGMGGLGAVVGLVVGLFVHPPTAVFAMVELGLPALIVGAVGGLLVGLVLRTAGSRSRG